MVVFYVIKKLFYIIISGKDCFFCFSLNSVDTFLFCFNFFENFLFVKNSVLFSKLVEI